MQLGFQCLRLRLRFLSHVMHSLKSSRASLTRGQELTVPSCSDYNSKIFKIKAHEKQQLIYSPWVKTEVHLQSLDSGHLQALFCLHRRTDMSDLLAAEYVHNLSNCLLVLGRRSKVFSFLKLKTSQKQTKRIKLKAVTPKQCAERS